MTNSKKSSTKSTPTIADKIREFHGRFVYLSDEAYADILALYVLHTWAFDTARVTPYIYVNSAERGSGKTTLLDVLHETCANAEMAANMTASALYAAVEAMRPTLMIDEVDAVWSGRKNEELRGMLNSGYNDRGSVLRNTGVSKNEDDPGFRRYSTFCPKVLAGIDNGLLPDTVADRSIKITLKRANAEQYAAIEDFYIEDEEEILDDLREEIQAWVAANRDALADRSQKPARLPELGPRQNQIAAPLLNIASRLGNGWYDRAKVALVSLLAAEDAKLSAQATALLKVREWFAKNPRADKIGSREVSEITGENGKQIGIWFNAYGIKSGTYSIEGENRKGYKKSEFVDAFERYLPAETSTETQED